MKNNYLQTNDMKASVMEAILQRVRQAWSRCMRSFSVAMTGKPWQHDRQKAVPWADEAVASPVSRETPVSCVADVPNPCPVDQKQHPRGKSLVKVPSAYGLQLQANTAQVKDFLQQHYEVRYNVLDGCAEVRHRSGAPLAGTEVRGPEAFQPVDSLTLNTIVLHLHENGIVCWDRDVSRLLQSRLMPQYHPLNDYLRQLPSWDGTDRVGPLARRVSDSTLWLTAFRCWMRAMVRQWQASAADVPNDSDAEGNQVTAGQRCPMASNQLALILISSEQGQHKSTFCRSLLPHALRDYYTDKFELAARSNLEFPLCRYALVNLDEFDRYSAPQMAKLKNLMQLGTLSVRRPRAIHFEKLQRTASFIGTSNTSELLTDPTGSRRFFCQEVDHLIDCNTPVDHDQLYAQVLHEVAQGLPCYLNKEEENAVQQHNRRYYKSSALGEAFLQMFEAAAEDSGGGEWLTVTGIFSELHAAFGSRVVAGSPCQLGRQLTFLRVPKKHSNRGTVYCVRRLDAPGREPV